jgi:protein subunit release factor A
MEDKKDRQLLFSVTKKDLKITYFSGTGAGGQHRNKHQNCCRIIHPESGAMATGQAERSKEQNTQFAFRSLVNSPKFQTWLKLKVAEMSQDKEKIRREIERKVEQDMKEENLKIEYFDPEDKNDR